MHRMDYLFCVVQCKVLRGASLRRSWTKGGFQALFQRLHDEEADVVHQDGGPIHHRSRQLNGCSSWTLGWRRVLGRHAMCASEGRRGQPRTHPVMHSAGNAAEQYVLPSCPSTLALNLDAPGFK